MLMERNQPRKEQYRSEGDAERTAARWLTETLARCDAQPGPDDFPESEFSSQELQTVLTHLLDNSRIDGRFGQVAEYSNCSFAGIVLCGKSLGLR